ncbi:hypothetical protein [Vreelandella arcis]|nr:hypothetical protein [Halomonas arcis]
MQVVFSGFRQRQGALLRFDFHQEFVLAGQQALVVEGANLAF